MPSFVEEGIVPLFARSRLAIDHIASEIGGTGITLAAFKMHEIGVMAKTVIVLAIAVGMDFQGGTLHLDLLQRDGKYNNGFCHYPDLVQFESGKRYLGAAIFTSN